MKQIALNLRKTLLLVELPEETIRATLSMGYLIAKVPNKKNWVNVKTLGNPVDLDKYLKTHKESDDYKDIAFKMQEGEWDNGVSFNSIPESYWEGVVEKPDDEFSLYEDYNGCNWIETAKDSVISAIKAEGWSLENPYGKHPDLWPYLLEAYHLRDNDTNAWQEAQSKVINLNNIWVFERKEVVNE